MKKLKCLVLFLCFSMLPLCSVHADSNSKTNLSFLKGAQFRVLNKDGSAVEKGQTQAKDIRTGVVPRAAASVSSSVKKQAINELYQGLMGFKKQVDLSAYKIPYSQKITVELLDEALEKNLYLFNTLANFSDFSPESEFCACYIDGSYIDSFEFQYGTSASTLKKQYTTLKQSVSTIQKKLQPEGKTKEQIVLAVHDYIALHTYYDSAKKPKQKSYTAYGALIDGKAVCSGYSLASQLLLKSCGVPVEIATSDKMDHAWSLVKLSGKWYHMDITWDDPNEKASSYVAYWFFLKTDKEFKKHPVAKHYSWDSAGIKCTSTRYSKIPLTDNQTLFWKDGFWYMEKKKGKSSRPYSWQKYNFTFTKTTSVVLSAVPFVKYQSRIYYAPSSGRIDSMNPDGSGKKKLMTLPSGSKLTSLKVKKNRVSYTYTQKKKKKSGSFSLTAEMKK